MGHIISVVNRKGGVGKTTVSLGLADTMIAETEKPYKAGNPVVVTVDLDPQGSLTRALLFDRKEALEQARLSAIMKEGRTFANCLKDRLGASRIDTDQFLTHGVGPVGKHYMMLANEASAWNVERWAIAQAGEAALRAAVGEILTNLASIYRYVIVDAPPGQTLISEAAIQVSDLVLCPTTPDLLSFWGLQSFDDYLRDVCSASCPPARFVFTKFKKKVPSYDPQDRVHDWVCAFKTPERYITLLREDGAASNGNLTINLPYDPKLVSRLEGAPNPGRQWPWVKMYTPVTQQELRRLVSAVKKELQSGEPRRPLSSTRAVDRANADATRPIA
jgi:cellulose biosynthesis protein BcsQ